MCSLYDNSLSLGFVCYSVYVLYLNKKLKHSSSTLWIPGFKCKKRMSGEGAPSINLSRRLKSWALEISWVEKTFPIVGHVGTQGHFGAEQR